MILPASWETCMQVKKKQLELEIGTMDWFKIGKGTCQGCILSACLFNFYAEYIMQNAGLDESQAGIKIDEVERGEWKSWLETQHSKN